MILSIANDFTKTPGGRYRTDGEYSGEEFREVFLAPKYREALVEGIDLIVDLDGVAGYATSFLEEAFGGLVRQLRERVSSHLKLQTGNKIRQREVEEYISDAEGHLPND